MTPRLKIRRSGRAVVTGLVLGGVVAALAACDSDFTATVSTHQTVSGSLTFLVDQAAYDADADNHDVPKGWVESMFASAFPEGAITQGQQGDQVYDRVTFTDVSFDAFEHGIDVILGDGDENDVTTVSLTSTEGVYRFDATSVAGASSSTYGDAALDQLVLTFPTSVASTNGTASGDKVTWDFLANPDLIELHAVTKAPVKVTPTVSVAPGTLVKKGKARVGKRVWVTAPRALTAGTAVHYAWTVAGKAVGTAPSNKIRKKQAGKRLAVTVTYTRTGYVTVTKTASFGKIKR